MSDGNSERGGEARWPAFDLFHHPVPPNKGMRGRPMVPYVPEIFESIIRCLAQGWSQERVARAHGISKPTMNAVYFSTPAGRQARQHASDLYEAEMLARLDAQSRDGNTGATKALLARMDKARLGPQPVAAAKPARRKGVKEERREAAWDAGREDDGWGPLLHGETGRQLAN